MRWFDARQLVISGGLLSAAGMVIMSISQHFAGLCFGSFLAGTYKRSNLYFLTLDMISQPYKERGKVKWMARASKRNLLGGTMPIWGP